MSVKLTSPGAVIKVVHILPQERHNRFSCIDRGARKRFSRDDATMGEDFAHAPECCHGLLEVHTTVRQPVGTNFGLVESVGAGDGYVSSRLGRQKNPVETQEILCGLDCA